MFLFICISYDINSSIYFEVVSFSWTIDIHNFNWTGAVNRYVKSKFVVLILVRAIHVQKNESADFDEYDYTNM